MNYSYEELNEPFSVYRRPPNSRIDIPSQTSNYKGVLMCDRPVSKTPDAHSKPMPYSITEGKLPFFPSAKYNANSDTGLPPPKESSFNNLYAKMELRKKAKLGRTQFITKHRKWLKEYERQKMDEKLKKCEEALKKQESEQRFRETQQKLRKLLISKKTTNDEILKAMDESLTKNSTESIDEMLEKKNVNRSSEKSKEEKTVKKKTNDSSQEKQSHEKQPQDKHNESVDEVLQDLDKIENDKNVENLINFVENLDFKEYLNDFEVREALSVLQARIQSLRESSESKKTKNVPTTTQETHKPIETKTVKHPKDWDKSTKIVYNDNIYKSPEKERVPEKEKTAERERLSTSKQEREINRLIQDIKKHKKGKIEYPKSDPQIITHSPYHNVEAQVGGGSPQKRMLLMLKKDPEYVQNLPYLYRCPSI